MHEPARGLARNEPAFAKDPYAHALAALDSEIVARERAAVLVMPPLHRDAFGPLDMYDFVQHAAPAKTHWRTVGHFGHGLDHLRPGEQADRAGGGEGVRLRVSRMLH